MRTKGNLKRLFSATPAALALAAFAAIMATSVRAETPPALVAGYASQATGEQPGFSASAERAYEDWGAQALPVWHEDLSTAMLLVVLVHLAGVVVGSWQHRENLALAMLTGHKLGTEGESIAPDSGKWGTVVLLVVVALALWL